MIPYSSLDNTHLSLFLELKTHTFFREKQGNLGKTKGKRENKKKGKTESSEKSNNYMDEGWIGYER